MRGLAFLIFGAASMLIQADPGSIDQDRIQPYSPNPYYWQYKGAPVLPLGGSESAALFQWTGPKLRRHLDLLKSVGGNYVRNIVTSKGGEDVFPFRRTGTVYDLTRWNPTFWRRLDAFLRETQKRGIIVQLELWDGWDFRGTKWDASAWNPKNNQNYSAEATGLPTSWRAHPSRQSSPFVLTVPKLNGVQDVLRFQERFAAKVLETSRHYDHVLFTIQNESRAPHEWSDYWAAFLHRQAAKRGRKIEVTDMRDQWNLTAPAHTYVINRPELYTYVEVSQNNHISGQRHWDRLLYVRTLLSSRPKPMNSVKVYIKVSNWPVTEADRRESSNRFWRNVFAGAAAVRFHRSNASPHQPNPPDKHMGHGLTATAQQQIRSLRIFTDAMSIFETTPRNDLLSEREDDEAYCLAQPGKQYAVFFPDGGSIDLDLTPLSGELRARWFDIATGTWAQQATIRGGGPVSLQAPGAGQWAVLILAAT